MDNKILQSKTITLLRFPLAIGVVMIHASVTALVVNGQNILDPASVPVYIFIDGLLNKAFTQIAVPLFFFISGFLFFNSGTEFNIKIYFAKIKKRAKTLLIPYILWNFIVIILLLIGQTAFPDLMSGRNKLIVDYTLKDWVLSFWDTSYRTNGLTLPINGPLWFIRDLMMVMILSPVIFLIIKYIKKYAILIMALVWLSGYSGPCVGLSMVAIFFYSTGAWFGINRKPFVYDCKAEILITAFVIYIAAACLIQSSVISQSSISNYLNKLELLAGCVLAIQTAAYLIRNGRCKENYFLAGSSFFLFAYHGVAITYIEKILWKVATPAGDMAVLLFYFTSVVVTVAIGLSAYWLCRKFAPSFTALITGGR